jgi:hypothetical protein
MYTRCNACGKIYETWAEAVECCPDVEEVSEEEYLAYLAAQQGVQPTAAGRDSAEKIQKAAAAKMNDLQIKEYAFKRAEMIENYIACYIKQTGLKADEIVLVEKRSNDGLRVEWYCEPKSHLTLRATDGADAFAESVSVGGTPHC